MKKIRSTTDHRTKAQGTLPNEHEANETDLTLIEIQLTQNTENYRHIGFICILKA